jgi:hypothetical protein
MFVFGEMSKGKNFYGAKCLRGEILLGEFSMGRGVNGEKSQWDEMSVERNVHWAYNGCGAKCLCSEMSWGELSGFLRSERYFSLNLEEQSSLGPR